MKRQKEEETQQRTRNLVLKLTELVGDTVTLAYRDEKRSEFYRKLKDTFNAFDKDGNLELGYPEYVQAWRYLGQPGTEADIKKAFDSVDLDHSGLVEWDEFVFSIMGEEALQYGHLADMERLSILLEATTQMWLKISNELQNQSAMLTDANA